MTVFDMLIKLIGNFYRIFSLSFFLLFLYQSSSISNEVPAIEIDSPRFSEKGLDNRLYEIKAERGIQKENVLELYNVEGKLRTDSGIWIYLNSERGNFNQKKNIIELIGKIKFYTDENDKFQSDYAIFSINNDLIKFNQNVQHIKGSNTITADESKMKDNFDHIIYEGNVSTLYVID